MLGALLRLLGLLFDQPVFVAVNIVIFVIFGIQVNLIDETSSTSVWCIDAIQNVLHTCIPLTSTACNAFGDLVLKTWYITQADEKLSFRAGVDVDHQGSVWIRVCLEPSSGFSHFTVGLSQDPTLWFRDR